MTRSLPHPAALLLLLGLGMTLLGGCTTLPTDIGKTTAADDPQPSWHYARFQLHPDNRGQVQRHLDSLIADQVLDPLLARHADTIPLWRFHRRWPGDEVGHLFSLIFLAPRATADAIQAGLIEDPVLARLTDDGHLRAFFMEHTGNGDPAGTSDPRWPPALQRTWPALMMGASQTWLGLARAAAAREADTPLYARYRAVEAALDSYWVESAHHAVLHHLNALFGYRPLRLPDGGWQRF